MGRFQCLFTYLFLEIPFGFVILFFYLSFCQIKLSALIAADSWQQIDLNETLLLGMRDRKEKKKKPKHVGSCGPDPAFIHTDGGPSEE